MIFKYKITNWKKVKKLKIIKYFIDKLSNKYFLLYYINGHSLYVHTNSELIAKLVIKFLGYNYREVEE